MPDILHLTRIKAEPERVYRALTTAVGIQQWWTRDAALNDKSGEFRFLGGQRVTLVKVDDLTPNRRVAWTTTASNAPGGWDGTRISFDLRAEGGETVIAFAHRGFREESEGFALVSSGWAYFLASLRQYVETGKGAPHQEMDHAAIAQACSSTAAPEIRHEVKIKATPAAVYRALTDAQQLGAWWIPDTRGLSQPGATLEFWFNATAHQDLRVATLEPDRMVRWQALAADLSDWSGTEIEFRIIPGEAETRLQFCHSGWRHGVERFPYYSLSWAVFLISLKDFLEKGEGHPFPNTWIH